MEGRYVFTVSEMNQFIKELLDNVPPLQEVLLRGEISNYKVYPSGHHYFTLKDSQSSLKCVMFKTSTMRLRFRPENGMQVIAAGRISVYPRDGAYQLYCTGLTPEGVGDLSVAFEQLKEGGTVRRGAQKAAAGISPAHRHCDVPGGCGGTRHDTHTAEAVSSCQGAAAAGAGTGRGGTGGDRGSHTVCQPARAGGCARHRAGRRLAGGSVGVQRRAGGAGHL